MLRLQMQLACEARNREALAKGWPPLETGIGVNTGIVVVGNMDADGGHRGRGSEARDWDRGGQLRP